MEMLLVLPAQRCGGLGACAGARALVWRVGDAEMGRSRVAGVGLGGA